MFILLRRETMPTPIEILLDPISLGVLALYGAMMLWEALTPGRKLARIKGWIPRAMGSFVVYFYLSSYLPLIWDGYLAEYQLFDLSSMGTIAGAAIGVGVYEGLVYFWHRALHQSDFLFQSFHQMHHSAERMDTYGAFYFSPLDMAGFTLLGSLSLSLIVGLSAQAVTVFLFATMFLGIFQHTSIKTPQWLGYFIQRPESHTIHHGKGLHKYNYSDLPVFDIVFGTFRNPKGYEMDTGFYDGASARVADMLLCRDISKEEPALTEQSQPSPQSQANAT
jgi:sterol desaturase/sphingolipid hydroxylase (fatty acid hydroxylase superfamily)